jgi:hypothetical protein
VANARSEQSPVETDTYMLNWHIGKRIWGVSKASAIYPPVTVPYHYDLITRISSECQSGLDRGTANQ